MLCRQLANGNQFQKLRANRLILVGEDLPEDMIYEYKPRPPDAKNPLISLHEFELGLATCPTRCLLSPFHDCVEPATGKFAVERIPKRNEIFELEAAGVEFAWGIQAEYAISLVNIIIYHLAMLAGPFGFWLWWQANWSHDVENASVPLTTVLVLLSLFWSSADVLKMFR